MRRRDRLGASLALLVVASCAGSDIDRETWREPLTGMEFVRIEAGTFSMGTPSDELMREGQESIHKVTLSRPFFMGRHEVTQGQWERVMGENPSAFQDCGRDCPVENVSYVEIEAFLEAFEELSGEHFRLPTEAEWEYSCRAGTSTVFGIGDQITPESANFDGTDPYPGSPEGPDSGGPLPVGSFEPNSWGLYDMNGNVWEWMQDEHCPYPDGPVTDPVARCGSELLIIRGGSWYFGPDSTRCGTRYTHRPVDDGPSLGFRLVWHGVI